MVVVYHLVLLEFKIYRSVLNEKDLQIISAKNGWKCPIPGEMIGIRMQIFSPFTRHYDVIDVRPPFPCC